jgi:hypothetical protein
MESLYENLELERSKMTPSIPMRAIREIIGEALLLPEIFFEETSETEHRFARAREHLDPPAYVRTRRCRKHGEKDVRDVFVQEDIRMVLSAMARLIEKSDISKVRSNPKELSVSVAAVEACMEALVEHPDEFLWEVPKSFGYGDEKPEISKILDVFQKEIALEHVKVKIPQDAMLVMIMMARIIEAEKILRMPFDVWPVSKK